MKNVSVGEKVLVTGGTGTLGGELVPALLRRGASVTVLSRDENKQGELAKAWPGVRWILGDVRDATVCRDAVRNQDLVIHAASLKYVDRSEMETGVYASVNIGGTAAILDACLSERSVRRVVGISTDKACDPINAYGMTKALLEKMFMEAQYRRRAEGGADFTVCRYGNVIGSRGSVVLRWQEALRKGLPIKVTDPEMTRFFFTVQDAVSLIDTTIAQPGGAIVSFAMPSARLGDLASLWSPDYEVLGPRPGEKTHEGLISEREMPFTSATYDGVLIMRPTGPMPQRRPKWTRYDSDMARRITGAELAELTKEWRS
jgi:UDP-N-acetylglucosamine 4,6-dehydratase